MATLTPVAKLTRRTLAGLLPIVAALSLAGGARADRGHDADHERARLAVSRGEALPLTDILARVGPGLGGEIVGVSFERKSGRWVYEFRVVASTGRLTDVYVDAATAKIIERETH